MPSRTNASLFGCRFMASHRAAAASAAVQHLHAATPHAAGTAQDDQALIPNVGTNPVLPRSHTRSDVGGRRRGTQIFPATNAKAARTAPRPHERPPFFSAQTVTTDSIYNRICS
jgi:hypothetical protein